MLRKISTRSQNAGVEKCRLVELLSELGLECEQSSSLSSQVCEKCARKIRTATALFCFFLGNLSAQTRLQSCPYSASESSPIVSKRFKDLNAWHIPLLQILPEKKPKARKTRRSINYGPDRSEIEEFVILNETEKPL